MLLFSGGGEGNENKRNQQVGEVSIPHFGDGKVEAQSHFIKCFVFELTKT